MKENKTKRKIYIRIFSALLGTYLVLMAGFSILLLSQENKLESLEFRTFAFQVNNAVEDVLRDNIEGRNRIADVSKIKKELVRQSPFFTYLGTELAIFTEDYNVIFNTSGGWLCSYTEYREGNKGYIGYAYLNPKDWFSEKEVAELESYLYASPKAKKVGDLTGYLINLEGFWLDNEMVIPDKISVTPMFATSFDKYGNVTSSSGTNSNDIIYESGYKDVKGLPYFEHGGIAIVNRYYPDSEKQISLRNMVLNKEKLEESVKGARIGYVSHERVNLLTYRYYLVLPYQNTVKETGDNSYYSEFWTAFAREVNLLDRCAGTLAFVWGSCFITFIVVALILSSQTYKTYKKREELERHRKEMTNALAHDLKTPLSIISGYAQNLAENVHTDKRERYAASIQANVDRMDKIIREMLDLSRLESDFLQIKFEAVPLGEVCREIINRYDQVCNERSIRVHLEGDAVIKADASLIERVIDNFFVNALDNTPDGGEICIRISGCMLEFYNSGSHIPEERMDEIWQPYKKADAARSNTKGTGLGLSICRAILELYKFSYGAKNIDDGVIFWFKFA